MSLKTRLSLVFIALSASSSPLLAEELEIITVTGTRFETPPEEQLAVTHTIERDEITVLQPKSVVDLLERLPGMSVTRSGGSGQNVSIFVRGANSDHVLVLVDGIRISSATLGSTDFSAVSPEQIERIEVVKGPRASVWGSDAIGGVIQIFTRKFESGQYYATVEAGSEDYGRVAIGGGLSHGDGRTSVVVSAERSDGFDAYQDSDEPDADGYDRLNFGVNGEQQLSESWQLAWQGQYNGGNSEFDDQFGATGNDQTDFENYFWNLSARYQDQRLSSQLNVGQSQDSNDMFRDGIAGKSRFETDRDQLGWNNQYLLNDSVIVIAGVDFSSESINGDYAESDRDLIGIYALSRVDLEQWLLEAAVRYDDVEDIDSETSFNVNVAYRFSETWRLSGSYGTGFKAPTFNDLYWPELGNPDLLSETSNSSEITLDYGRENVTAYLSVFKSEVDDLIDWSGTGEFDDFGWEIYKPNNVDNVAMTGVELGSQFELFGLSHELAYTYLDSEDKATGKELISRSEHEANYAVSYLWQQFDARLDYHYQGKRYAGDVNFDGNDDYLAAYNKVDLSIGYQMTDLLSVRAKLNNAFDEETTSIQAYNSAGREWYLSLSYNNF